MKNVLKSVLISEFTLFLDLILQFMVVKCLSRCLSLRIWTLDWDIFKTANNKKPYFTGLYKELISFGLRHFMSY